jgi:phospholipase D-like protein/putative oligomerization/nucleic acid binding protein
MDLAVTANYPLLAVFWTMLEFFAFVIFIFLVFTLATDIFRSDDLSGWAKAAWLVFILFIPFIGMLCYLIARGRSMRERADAVRVQRMREQEIIRSHMTAQQQEPTAADQLSRLADLRQRGVLSAEEFDREKAKVLSQ